jgi:acetyl esterase/lipase
MHPAHISDVDAAVDWVRAHIAEYGGDPTRVVLIGHSAGGHLVALASTHARYHAGAVCTVVIDSDQFDLSHGIEFGGPDEQASIEQAFGTDPATLQDGSPLRQVTASAPPPPMLVITRGSEARMQRAHEFAALVNTVSEADVVEAGAVSHEEVNNQLGTPADAIATPVVADFLRSCATLSRS